MLFKGDFVIPAKAGIQLNLSPLGLDSGSHAAVSLAWLGNASGVRNDGELDDFMETVVYGYSTTAGIGGIAVLLARY